MANKKGKNEGYSYRVKPSGKVECRAYFDMPDGTRQQLGATDDTEDKARKKLNSKYAEICKQGKQIKSKGYTVKSWCSHWLFDLKPDLKGGTFDGYYSAFKNHIYPEIGKVKIKDLTLSKVQKVITTVSNKTVISKGKVEKIKGKTVKEIIAPFLQALDFAMEDNLMPYINFKKLNRPKVKKRSREIRNENEQQIVTDYFANRIPDKPFNLYYAPIMVIDARGLRPEECAGLQWQDIDYENDTFWAGRHTVVKNGIYENHKKIREQLVVEDSAKSKAGERELPLGIYLSNLFKAKYQEYINNGIIPKPTDFIFINKVGNLYYEQSLRLMYKSLAKKLGIAELGCYSLRHEFATYLAQIEKCDQETFKQLMGWEEIVDTYIHTDNKKKQKAVLGIDHQFNNKNEQPKEDIYRISPKIELPQKQKVEINRKSNIIQFPTFKVVNQ